MWTETYCSLFKVPVVPHCKADGWPAFPVSEQHIHGYFDLSIILSASLMVVAALMVGGAAL